MQKQQSKDPKCWNNPNQSFYQERLHDAHGASLIKRIKTYITWDELYAVERAFFTLDRFRKEVDEREDIQKDILRIWSRLCREMGREQPKNTKQVEIELGENDMGLIEDLFFCEMNDQERGNFFGG